MDIEKMRWLSSREEQREENSYRYSLFVTHIGDESACLILFGYQIVQEPLSNYYEVIGLNSIRWADDQNFVLYVSDLLRAEHIHFTYSNTTLSGALDWIENHGFNADIYMLAELARALDE